MGLGVGRAVLSACLIDITPDFVMSEVWTYSKVPALMGNYGDRPRGNKKHSDLQQHIIFYIQD